MIAQVHRTTAARSFSREKINAKFRRSREKPQRTSEHETDRTRICKVVRKWPVNRFHGLDLIMDNKKWAVATTALARALLQKQKVKGQIRTPSEGLRKHMTKPNQKKHRTNPGGSVTVCAGIVKSRICLWEYVEGKWNGQKAADLYRGPIKALLKRKHGAKKKYIVAEDNDPTGYKSNKAIQAKKDVGIHVIEW